jgi:hypothetical protein
MATVRILLRRGTAAQWEAANTVLAQAEAGVETDTGRFKLGDGVTPWITLPYSASTRLEDLVDVDSTEKTDGSVLTFDAATAKFRADANTTKLTLTDGGNF